MQSINNFIDNLIPHRFKLTYELKTKAQGVVISQIIIGLLLFIIGLFLWIVDKEISVLILNIGMGIVLLASIFILDFFDKLESYVGLLLSIGYIVITIFVLIFGGIYDESPFWYAILLTLSITYTTLRQSLFWIVYIFIFLGALFYLQTHGLDLTYVAPSEAKQATTLISFFTLLIVSTYSYTRINVKETSFHLEIIDKHKRLLKERDDLMSIVAHDMKSPSLRIEGLISIFDKSNLTEDQKHILSMLNNTAIENQQLIHDLIEATRFQSNLDLKMIHVNDVIIDLQDGYLPLSNKKNIRLITYGLSKKIDIESSPHHLKRILDNLLSNAIKFSPLESRVEITCVQNKLKTSISIKDQGPGFSKEDEAEMFKMFQKLSAQPTGGETSSGLGLSIVKNLSELLKGEIKYVTQVGIGSTFTLVLPNKFPQADAASSTI